VVAMRRWARGAERLQRREPAAPHGAACRPRAWRPCGTHGARAARMRRTLTDATRPQGSNSLSSWSSEFSARLATHMLQLRSAIIVPRPSAAPRAARAGCAGGRRSGAGAAAASARAGRGSRALRARSAAEAAAPRSTMRSARPCNGTAQAGAWGGARRGGRPHPPPAHGDAAAQRARSAHAARVAAPRCPAPSAPAAQPRRRTAQWCWGYAPVHERPRGTARKAPTAHHRPPPASSRGPCARSGPRDRYRRRMGCAGSLLARRSRRAAGGKPAHGVQCPVRRNEALLRG
jgi:hypothetical protein